MQLVPLRLTLAVGLLSLFVQASPSTAAAQSLSIRFDSTSTDERYSPQHVMAVWIERENGDYVDTVSLWAARRRRHLINWINASGTDVDVVTGATLFDHGTRYVEWDVTDNAGDRVPDGSYRLRIEVCEANSSTGNENHDATFSFEVGGAGVMRGTATGIEDIRIGTAAELCADNSVPVCADDDGCCPADCTPENDGDCVPEPPDAGTMSLDAGAVEDAGAPVDAARADSGSGGEDATARLDASRGPPTSLSPTSTTGGLCSAWPASGPGRSTHLSFLALGLLLFLRRARHRQSRRQPRSSRPPA